MRSSIAWFCDGSVKTAECILLGLPPQLPHTAPQRPTKATFDNEAFYYISQTRKRYVAFDKPRLVDQKVLAVYFGEDGRVSQIANYGLKDGKVFDFISRTTPTGGKDQNFLSQIINGASKLAPGLPGGGGSTPGGT